MLNVNASKGNNTVKVIASGSNVEIFSDLTQVIRSLIQGMQEHDEDYATMFKLMFLKGLDDGIIFDCTPEEMAEMRELLKKVFDKKSDSYADTLKNLLKDMLEGLNETK